MADEGQGGGLKEGSNTTTPPGNLLVTPAAGNGGYGSGSHERAITGRKADPFKPGAFWGSHIVNVDSPSMPVLPARSDFIAHNVR